MVKNSLHVVPDRPAKRARRPPIVPPDAAALADTLTRFFDQPIRPEQVEGSAGLLAMMQEWVRVVPGKSPRRLPTSLTFTLRACQREYKTVLEYADRHRAPDIVAKIAALRSWLEQWPAIEERDLPPRWHGMVWSLCQALKGLFEEGGMELPSGRDLTPLVQELLAQAGIHKGEPTVRNVMTRRRLPKITPHTG